VTTGHFLFPMQSQNRQLAAILFTDIVGYTAMMQKNEPVAVAMVKHYISILKKTVTDYEGKILNDYGDGSLCIFPSSMAALKAAIDIQRELQNEPAVPLRIGLHLGEIFFEDEKVMGDSINVASRIQSLGQANTILFSKEIFDKTKNQPGFKAVSVGRFEFKNIDEPMEIFALSNEGLKVPKREEMTGKLKELQKRSSTKIVLTGLAIVSLIAIYFILKSFSAPQGFKGEKSIAVLPFENIEADPNEEYLSDGITQGIISNLSKVASLEKVIAWFSVRGFKKTNKTLNQISAELNVAAILSGRIQKHDNKMQISVELIEARTNKRLWGDDFEYLEKDILSIQPTVAKEIANALSATITPEEGKRISKNYTENIEAYKLYRKGRSFWDKRSMESYDSAEANYKKAIDLDPDYALAYAGLADCYTFNQKGLSQVEAIPIARDYATKALQLDSNLAEAQTTLAFIQSHFDYDWAGAKIKFRKIIKENPNYSFAHLYYGNVLLFTDEKELGLAETRKALSLDPLSATFNFVLGRNYYFARKYDSSLAQLQKNITLNPKFFSSYYFLGLVYFENKKFDLANNAFSRLPDTLTDQGYGLLTKCYGFARSGDIARAHRIFSQIPANVVKTFPVFIAYYYMASGDVQKALDYLEEANKIHTLYMLAMKVDPIFDPIRNEPRFKTLLKKMNFE
jgi:adenylate cyclase